MNDNLYSKDLVVYTMMDAEQKSVCETGVCPNCSGQLDLYIVTHELHFYKCKSCHDIWTLRTS